MGEENRNEKPKKGGILQRLLLVILVISLAMIGKREWDSMKQRQREAELAELARLQAEQEMQEAPEPETEASLPEETEPPYESPIDFEALRKINPDIVAWLTIPGTVIDYPVVQTDDNETYLKKDFEGNASSAGAIYLDCDSDSDLKGMHSVLYGHHMRNGSMFADIVKFKKEDFFQENREVILYLPEEELHLRTIAAIYGDASGEKRRTQFENEEHFQQYIDEMTKNCSFRELPASATRLYSFVTCSYEFNNARTILYAVPEEDLSKLTYPVERETAEAVISSLEYPWVIEDFYEHAEDCRSILLRDEYANHHMLTLYGDGDQRRRGLLYTMSPGLETKTILRVIDDPIKTKRYSKEVKVELCDWLEKGEAVEQLVSAFWDLDKKLTEKYFDDYATYKDGLSLGVEAFSWVSPENEFHVEVRGAKISEISGCYVKGIRIFTSAFWEEYQESVEKAQEEIQGEAWQQDNSKREYVR